MPRMGGGLRSACRMPAGGRCAACGGGRREACGMPAGGRCPVCSGRPRNACGGLRGPRSRACGDLHGPRNACGRPMSRAWRRPAGGLRNARGCRGPAWRRPAGGLRNARGRPMSRACSELRRPRNACENRCPARGSGLREACGMPAGDRCPACTASRVGRGTPVGDRCLRRTTQGGRIQRPPKRLSSPLPGACRAFGPPGPSARESGGMRGVSG